MTKKWSSRLTFFAFVVLMVGLGSNDSLRGIFSTIFQEHFSLTTTQLGLIVTASYIGNLVFLLVGWPPWRCLPLPAITWCCSSAWRWRWVLPPY